MTHWIRNLFICLVALGLLLGLLAWYGKRNDAAGSQFRTQPVTRGQLLATITATVLSPIAGTIEFDPATGRVRYSPDTDDKRPFMIRFAATSGGQTRTQDVTITPMPHLPAEQTAFGLAPAGEASG